MGHASSYHPAPEEIKDPHAFYVRVHGDSMAPTLEDGDLAVVEPGYDLVNGKVCFASFPGNDGERLVKRYRRLEDGTIHLESDNRDHPTRVLTPENGRDVRIFRVTGWHKSDK